MGLFQSEETFKEKVDSNNNWNTDQFILRIVIRIYNRNIEFCVCVCVCVCVDGGGGGAAKILPKRYLFIFCII